MNITAATDYGLQALLHIAHVQQSEPDRLVTSEEISNHHEIPIKFLETILRSLSKAGFIDSKRGVRGGYRLTSHPKEISIADVIRSLDGPLAAVRGERPESIRYKGSSKELQNVWIATRVALREILENVTLDDMINNRLPRKITQAIAKPDAWKRRNH